MQSGKRQSYEVVPTKDSFTQPKAEVGLNFVEGNDDDKEKRGCCGRLLRNKCCIACLVILVLLALVVLGVYISIKMMLKEHEKTADGSRFKFVNYTFRTLNVNLSEPLDLNLTSVLVEEKEFDDDFNETAAEILRPVSIYSDFGIDIRAWEPPENVAKEVFYYTSGYDMEGRPVYFLPFGSYDFKKLLTTGTTEEIEENSQALDIFFDQLSFRIYDSCYAARKNNFVLIIDMENYSYGQVWSWTTTSFVIKLSKKFAIPLKNVGYGYIVNLDTVSRILLNMVRPILSGSLDGKIVSYGTDKDEYVAAILEKIAPDQLPEKYGGTQPDHPAYNN